MLRHSDQNWAVDICSYNIFVWSWMTVSKYCFASKYKWPCELLEQIENFNLPIDFSGNLKLLENWRPLSLFYQVDQLLIEETPTRSGLRTYSRGSVPDHSYRMYLIEWKNDFHHFYNEEARIMKEGAVEGWRGEEGVQNEGLGRVLWFWIFNLHLSV